MADASDLEAPNVGLDGFDGAQVEELLNDITGHLNAQHGRLVDVAIWLLANVREWQGERLWTPVQYLTWRCGVSLHTARKLVSIAERATELPESVNALRRGELSMDQLMPIVRKVPTWADEQMLSLAKRLSVQQIASTVNKTNWDWTPGPAAASENVASEAETAPTSPAPDTDVNDNAEAEPDLNRVSYGHRDDGRWYLHADLDGDLGDIIEKSLDEAHDAVFQATNSNVDLEDGTPAGTTVLVTLAEALAEIAQRSLDAVPSTTRRNRHRINYFLDVDSPLSDTQHRKLPSCLAELVTCDGSIDPVFVRNGTPISVGRSQRIVPDRTRRTVLRRDNNTCQVPGCTATHRLDIHHIIHWSKHGPTDTTNLIALCSRHHRMHHKGQLGISGDADDSDTLEFTDSRGRAIRRSGAKPTPPTNAPAPITGTYERPLGERLDHRWVTFSNPADWPHRTWRPDDRTA